MKIVYYVSGHGYGHATRVCEVVRCLLSTNHHVTIVSAAPEFIFHDVIILGAKYRRSDIDAGGVVQQGPLEVNVDLTINQVDKFMNTQREPIITCETTWLQTQQPDLVAVDAAFAPLVSAQSLQIPSVVISNFTWDAIYADYIDSAVAERIRQDYAKATWYLRLPGYIEVPAFKERPGDVINVPLVVRRSRTTKQTTRQTLNIAPQAKVVLIQFGGHESSKPWGEVTLPPDWIGIIVTDNTLGLPKYLRGVSKESYLPDLVEAADVVLGKLGYGTCSEAISSKRPLVYVNRTNFNEQVGLLNLMTKFGCAVELSVEKFLLGHWAASILEADEAMKRLSARAELSNEGGKYVAEQVVKLAETRTKI